MTTLAYNTSIQLGQGFNNLKGTEAGYAIVSPADTDLENNDIFSTEFRSKLVESSNDAREVLDVSGSIQIQSLATANGGGIQGRYLRSTDDDEKATHLLITCDVITKSQSLKIDTIKVDDKTLASLNQQQFDDMYGDHLVKEMTYGGRLIISLVARFKSVQEKETVEAKADLTYGVVTASGQFNLDKLSALENSEIEIQVFSVGADIPNVPQTLNDMQALANQFPKLVHELGHGGALVKITLFPYSNLRPFQEFFQDLTWKKQIQHRIDTEYADLYLSYSKYKDSMTNLYGTYAQHPEMYDHLDTNHLEQAIKDASSNLNNIYDWVIKSSNGSVALKEPDIPLFPKFLMSNSFALTQSGVTPTQYETLSSMISKFNVVDCGSVYQSWGGSHVMWTGNGARSQGIPIKFNKTFASPPRVFLAISEMDEGSAHNIRISCVPTQITTTGAVAQINVWADTQIWSAGVTWIATL